jgi:hypothetical protein
MITSTVGLRRFREAMLMLLVLLGPGLAQADVLDTYSLLVGRTVLMPASLPALPDSLVSDLPGNKTKAVAKIEEAFADKGIAVVQDGPHFVRLVPKRELHSLTNAPLRGVELALAKGPDPASKGQAAMPPGVINFSGADLNQVLSIYATLRQKTILRPAILPWATVRLKTQGRLTREEVLYALETVLALNGVALVDDGAKFVQVVPIGQRAQVKTNCPAPEPGAKQFDPNKVPAMGVTVRKSPRNEMERLDQEYERLRTAVYQFMHMREPQKNSSLRLLELYARLADKTAVASTNFDGVAVNFHVETPLTRSELLYAIETTLRLNGLGIVLVDDRKVRLSWAAQTPSPISLKPREPRRAD